MDRNARIQLLYLLAHELLEEELSQAVDLKQPPSWDRYDEACYASLVADRHWVIHVLDFTEEEVAHAARNHWEAFVC